MGQPRKALKGDAPVLSEWPLDPGELLVLEGVREAVAARVARRAAEIDARAEFPLDIRQLWSEIGLMGLTVPDAYGGTGGRSLLFAAVLAEIARACLNSSNILSQQDLAMGPLLHGGSEAQKRAYLPKLASGEWLGAFALTEPEAGSDNSGMRTVAVRDGDEYAITGQKAFITWGNMADVVTVFARTNPEAGTRGISAFLVERGTPGLLAGPVEKKMGLRGSPTVPLYLDNVRIPADHLLGQEGQGFKIAMQALNHGRLAIAAQAAGLAHGALEYAANYVKERRQFGQRIADFQGIQFLLAERFTQIEAARQLTIRAALAEGSTDFITLAAMAKLFATDLCMEVTVDAVQLLGGYGYITEYPVERMMRDAKILQIVEGTSQIQKVIIANRLLRS